MKAFLIDAGFYRCTVERFAELGSIRDDVWFGNVVYAETAAKAKHLFIAEHNNSYYRPGMEYADKMSIRVLATQGDEMWKPHVADAYEYEEADWMRGKLSKYGIERHEQWLKDQVYFSA